MSQKCLFSRNSTWILLRKLTALPIPPSRIWDPFAGRKKEGGRKTKGEKEKTGKEKKDKEETGLEGRKTNEGDQEQFRPPPTILRPPVILSDCDAPAVVAVVIEDAAAAPRASQQFTGHSSSIVNNSNFGVPRTSASLATPRVSIPEGTTDYVS